MNTSLVSIRKRMIKLPKFISVDGIDCSGKSTLCESIKKELESKGQKVKVVHFPRVSPWGDEAKRLLKSSKAIEDNKKIQELCIADMVDYSLGVNRANAEKDYDVIILDRFFLSTLAYSDCSFLVDIAMSISDSLRGKLLLRPDKSFLITPSDVEFDIIKKRLRIKKNKDTFENIKFLKEVNHNYKHRINDHSGLSEIRRLTLEELGGIKLGEI